MTLVVNHRQLLNGSKSSFIKLFILFNFLFANVALAEAQTNQDSLKVHTINGQKYYIHVVEAGNTLYGISRIYAISVEELQDQNPIISKNLNVGDELLIPIKQIKKKDINENLGHDGNFLIYKVQEKNTLYSIAKEFDVDIRDLRNENPELENGLKVGQELRIPLAKIRKNEGMKAYSEPAVFGKYRTHSVQPKETLYSLSKLYQVEIDSILWVNEGLKEGLKIGQTINIPIRLKNEIRAIQKSIPLDSNKIKEEYTIALLLPFYLNKIALASDSADMHFLESEKALYKHASYAVEFYEGFLLAVDSMKKNGLSVKLHVYDTQKDSSRLRRILEKPHMKELDLIVGPLFFDEFLIASDFSDKHNIHIVSPVKQSNKILLGNSNVSKVVSSDPVLLKSLAHFLADSLNDQNILFVFPDNVEERINADILQKNYKIALAENGDSSFRPLPDNFIWKNASSFNSLKFKLAYDSLKYLPNYLVIPSDNQAFVTQILTSLNGISSKYNITVIGMEAWERYSNLDLDYLHNLHLHLLLSEFIDESDEDVKSFKNKFYNKYENLPDKFSYLGFDVGSYYLSLLNRYGANFHAVIEDYQKALLGREFNFFKTGIESGFENHSYNIIKYQNFEKVVVK